jgi:UDP-N-acetylmuramate dehydrogenase
MLVELGLKGLRVGDAMVSPKHAGFIVNAGSATARDVRALMEKIQNIVEREKGFRPVSEIRRIPEDV